MTRNVWLNTAHLSSLHYLERETMSTALCERIEIGVLRFIAKITMHSFLLQITKQQEVGETKTQAVRSARRGEIPQKAHESSGSISDETEKERSCSGEKQDSQKEFSPRVEKSPDLGSSNIKKENLNSSSDKPAEVPNGDDKVIQLPKQLLSGNKFHYSL